jgi:hypothetical protein
MPCNMQCMQQHMEYGIEYHANCYYSTTTIVFETIGHWCRGQRLSWTHNKHKLVLCVYSVRILSKLITGTDGQKESDIFMYI